jgi:hypothetical protein
MTFHPERYIGFGFLLLLFSVVAPPAMDWWRGNHPHAVTEYRGRINHIPRPVRETVEKRAAGAEASWVKEGVEDGAWVYELHVLKHGRWSVTRITANGNVIPPDTRDSVRGSEVEGVRPTLESQSR